MNSADGDRNERNGSSRRREPVTYTDYSIFRGNVLVVGDGKPRVMDRDEAIELAKSMGMNLVQIAYHKNENPRSVCKIMDYSKFRYEQKKREKEEKRRRRESAEDVKEIKFSIRIDDGDKRTKISKVKEILADGDKVKLSIRLLRREMQRPEMAKDTMMGILAELEGLAELDQPPVFAGNTLSCTVRRRK